MPWLAELGRDPPRRPRRHRRRRALDRHGGRRPLPRRGRGHGAGRGAGGVPRAGRPRPRRAAGPLRPDARPVPDARTGAPLGPAGRHRRGRARAAARSAGRSCAGEFRPGGAEREWCDPDVLRLLRRRSLARLRREVEPVDPRAFARFLPTWQGVVPVAGPGSDASPFRGDAALERLAEVVDQLGGVAIPASVLERDVLPSRVPGYQPRLLDELGAMGEVGWVGRGSLGRDDGRIALFRPGRDALRPPAAPDDRDERRQRRAARADPRAPRRAWRLVLPRDPSRGRRRLATARCSTRCGTSCGPAR